MRHRAMPQSALMDPAFTLARTVDEPGTARLRLAGEFDSDNHAALLEFLLEAVHDAAVVRVAVDMSATTFMDSSGLRAVESARAAADAAGKGLHVLDPAPGVRRLFEIAEMWDMFPDEDRRRGQAQDARDERLTHREAVAAARDQARIERDTRDRERDRRSAERERQLGALEVAADQHEIDARWTSGPDAGEQ